MDRYWLLTSTFYGNRLPGDPRGFVSRVRDMRPGDAPGTRHEHDIPERRSMPTCPDCTDTRWST